MMGIGRATTNTPQTQHADPTTLPDGVVGKISPYCF